MPVCLIFSVRGGFTFLGYHRHIIRSIHTNFVSQTGKTYLVQTFLRASTILHLSFEGSYHPCTSVQEALTFDHKNFIPQKFSGEKQQLLESSLHLLKDQNPHQSRHLLPPIPTDPIRVAELVGTTPSGLFLFGEVYRSHTRLISLFLRSSSYQPHSIPLSAQPLSRMIKSQLDLHLFKQTYKARERCLRQSKTKQKIQNSQVVLATNIQKLSKLLRRHTVNKNLLLESQSPFLFFLNVQFVTFKFAYIVHLRWIPFRSFISYRFSGNVVLIIYTFAPADYLKMDW